MALAMETIPMPVTFPFIKNDVHVLVGVYIASLTVVFVYYEDNNKRLFIIVCLPYTSCVCRKGSAVSEGVPITALQYTEKI